MGRGNILMFLKVGNLLKFGPSEKTAEFDPHHALGSSESGESFIHEFCFDL